MEVTLVLPSLGIKASWGWHDTPVKKRCQTDCHEHAADISTRTTRRAVPAR
jgi:hypothetical protein